MPKNRGIEILSSDSGSKQIPTIISYQNDKRVFAEHAEPQKITNKQQTYYYLPLLLGEKMDSKSVQRARKIGSKFELKPDENNYVVGQAYFGDKQVQIRTESMVTAMLNQVLKYAQLQGDNPSDIVLTVPPHWSSHKKQLLRTCAESCKLNVIGIIPQHIAVATNYYMRRIAEFQKLPDNNPGINVAFLSIGEVSSWFAVVKMKKSGIETLSITTDIELGSIDMDMVLVDLIKAQALQKCKLINSEDLERPKTQIKLLKAANNAKKVLTINSKAPATLECIGDNQVDVQTLISIEDFNQALQEKSDILDRVKNLIQGGLKGLQIQDLECIECVGGASRVKEIQRIVKEIFTEQKVGRRLNPDEAVSIGLGWYGALHSSKHRVRYEIKIKDKILSLEDKLILQIYDSNGQPVFQEGYPRTLYENYQDYPKDNKQTYSSMKPGQYTCVLQDGDIIHYKASFIIKNKNFSKFQQYQEMKQNPEYQEYFVAQQKEVKNYEDYFKDDTVPIEIAFNCDSDGYFKISRITMKDYQLSMKDKLKAMENENYDKEMEVFNEQVKVVNDKYDAQMKEYEEKKKVYDEEYAKYQQQLKDAKNDEERKKIVVPEQPKKPEKDSLPTRPSKTVQKQVKYPKIDEMQQLINFNVEQAIYSDSQLKQDLQNFEQECQKIDQLTLDFEKNKNELDAIIYQTRDGLNYDLKQYVTEKESQTISQMLDDAQSFAETVESKDQIEELKQRIQYYQRQLQPFYDRKQQFSRLDDYQYEGKQYIDRIVNQYEKYQKNKDIQDLINKLQNNYEQMKQEIQQMDRTKQVDAKQYITKFEKQCKDLDKQLQTTKEKIDKEEQKKKEQPKKEEAKQSDVEQKSQSDNKQAKQ